MDIFDATKRGNLDIVITLIKEDKGNINHTDENGRTALHYAALKGHLNIIRALTKLNAEIDARDNNNVTPLWLGAVYSYKDIMIVLLKYGADPNAKNQAGTSVLHIAASNNNLAIVKLLIKYGGNVNATNDFNWSVIHSAAFGITEKKGNWKVIEYLLKHNADYIAKDKDSTSVRDLFCQENYSYVKCYDKLIETNLHKKISSDPVIEWVDKELNQFNWTEIELLTHGQKTKRTIDNIVAAEYKLEQMKQQVIKTESKIEIVKEMLLDNEPIERIIKYTKLSKEKIIKLKEDMKRGILNPRN